MGIPIELDPNKKHYVIALSGPAFSEFLRRAHYPEGTVGGRAPEWLTSDGRLAGMPAETSVIWLLDGWEKAIERWDKGLWKFATETKQIPTRLDPDGVERARLRKASDAIVHFKPPHRDIAFDGYSVFETFLAMDRAVKWTHEPQEHIETAFVSHHGITLYTRPLPLQVKMWQVHSFLHFGFNREPKYERINRREEITNAYTSAEITTLENLIAQIGEIEDYWNGEGYVTVSFRTKLVAGDTYLKLCANYDRGCRSQNHFSSDGHIYPGTTSCHRWHQENQGKVKYPEGWR